MVNAGAPKRPELEPVQVGLHHPGDVVFVPVVAHVLDLCVFRGGNLDFGQILFATSFQCDERSQFQAGVQQRLL